MEGGSCGVTHRRRQSHDGLAFRRFPWRGTVCCRHFHSGKPAQDALETDADWVPSRHMAHTEVTRTERVTSSAQSQTNQNPSGSTGESEAARGASGPGSTVQNSTTTDRDVLRRGGNMSHGTSVSSEPKLLSRSVTPAVPPWSQVKPLLLSALRQRTVVSQRPEEETARSVCLRDSFRTSLATSLEASSRSRGHVQEPASVSGDFQVDLNFKVPPLREEAQASCPNCNKLQRRIKELEEKLSRLTGELEVVEPSPVFSKTPVLPDSVQCPEPGHTGEDGPGWTEPGSAGDQDPNSTKESPSSGFAPWSSSVRRFRQSRSFNPAWLKMFWFLRYSQSLDRMWCHVCRVHADESHQNLPLIKGSNKFKIDNIKRHDGRNYHKVNVKRYSLHCWPKAAP